MEALKGRRHKSFTFKAFWLQDKECSEIIANSWQSSQTTEFNQPYRIEKVSKALIKWSQQKFSKAHNQIASLQQQLQSYINQPHSRYDKQIINNNKAENQRLWQQEEQFWAMQSRINWLKWGGRNTKFFHATTVQQRQQNRI